MSDLVFNIAMIWMVILFGICVVMVARSKSGFVRVLSLDALTLVLVALFSISFLQFLVSGLRALMRNCISA